MAKLTILIKDKNMRFKEIWQPILDYLYTIEKSEQMIMGFIY